MTGWNVARRRSPIETEVLSRLILDELMNGGNSAKDARAKLLAHGYVLAPSSVYHLLTLLKERELVDWQRWKRNTLKLTKKGLLYVSL